jgi:hypothetical protein
MGMVTPHNNKAGSPINLVLCLISGFMPGNSYYFSVPVHSVIYELSVKFLFVFPFLFHSSSFFYLVSKLYPVKRKIVAIPLLAATLVFIIAYTTIEKSSTNTTLVSSVDKKEIPVAKKTKVQKKKTKYKPAPVKSPRVQPPGEEEAKEQTKEGQTSASPENVAVRNLIAKRAFEYSAKNNLSSEYCFLVDMNLPSGRNRFFVYDLKRNSIVYSGLVAHGSCNETFLARPRFSNESRSGCSSLGKYQVGQFYTGKYGKSYRLTGLDNTNSNAFNRAVVIHGYNCVPDEEIYPRVLCNSLGCVMVSYKFFDKISRLINKSDKPILLWVYR